MRVCVLVYALCFSQSFHTLSSALSWLGAWSQPLPLALVELTISRRQESKNWIVGREVVGTRV